MKHWVAIWIDHNEARALALPTDSAGYTELAHVRDRDTHTHPKKLDGHRHPADARFLADVTAIVAKADEVVLMGPSHTKEELIAHIEKSHPELRARVLSVETLDRMSDGELAAHARPLFERGDRMRGVHVVNVRN